MVEKKIGLKVTFSTLLTLMRIAIVPFLIGAILAHAWLVALWLLIAAAITDIFDGALARLLNEETALGAYLDPIADKILILSCYLSLMSVNPAVLKIPGWFFSFILIKELLLIAGAFLLELFCLNTVVKPTWLGKTTMMIQTLFIMWLFICLSCHWVPVKTFYLSMMGVVVLVGASLVQYTGMGFKRLLVCILKD